MAKRERIVFTTAKWKKPDAFEMQHLGARAFLDPKTKKFPIRHTDNGPVYMKAVRTAVHYADMYGYKTVAKKAHALLAKYDKEVKREKLIKKAEKTRAKNKRKAEKKRTKESKKRRRSK